LVWDLPQALGIAEGCGPAVALELAWVWNSSRSAAGAEAGGERWGEAPPASQLYLSLAYVALA